MLKKLNWDTDFFKQPVFSVRLTATTDCEQLTNEISLIKTQHPGAILYLTCNATEKTSSIGHFIKQINAKSYGSRVDYSQQLLSHTHEDANPCIALTTPTSEAIQVAIGSSRHSRFRLDPRLEPHADALYERWILNGFEAAKDGRGKVLAVKVDEHVGGILSLSWDKDNTEAKIELVAVQPQFGRRGIGRTLVTQAISIAQLQGCSAISVVTQGENLPAMKLYESCGFKLCDKDWIWHLHL